MRKPTAGSKLHFSNNVDVSSDGSSDSEDSYLSAASKLTAGKANRRKPRTVSEKRKRSTDIIKNFPKGLYFDGKGNWEAFKQKFNQCAKALEWTTDECFTALSWSLTGKAADFYSVLGDQQGMTYQILLTKLENRFGARELPATAQARFQQASQSSSETLEDWADRVLTLAARAFRELPESYCHQQAVARFCQGLADKAVASQVSNVIPSTMEEAINNARWSQHVHQAVYGKKKDRTRVSDSESDDQRVYAVQQSIPAPAAQGQGTSTSTLNMMEKLLADFRLEIQQKLDQVSKSVSQPVVN
ncbi:MAG: hypothetical protein JAY75_23555, partial [Candidatus Thiodiazotropha taylori]|nr:hypothetical protein [Candidatus Thiodiazotropha taylori]MCW4311183.1 hypothetical protein [Candidatus Thiodiazotropha endolucinida]